MLRGAWKVAIRARTDTDTSMRSTSLHFTRYGLVTEQKKGEYKYFTDVGDRLEVVESKTAYIDKVCPDARLSFLHLAHITLNAPDRFLE